MTAPRAPFFPADQSIRADNHPIDVRYLKTIDYLDAWHLQADLAVQRSQGEINDTILVLEHPPIYTAGKRTEDSDRPTNGLPVIDVDRGGRITWHGPGQLVVYPIIKLADPIDVVDYVRRIEEALIQVIRNIGLPKAGRVDGRSGVWLPGDPEHRKVAALGIRITKGVTMHGLSLNCSNTLDYYEHIIPCGITDAGVTTLSAELDRTVTVEEMIEPLIDALTRAFHGELVVADHSFDALPDPSSSTRRTN
ncbi:lipoate-protein ligase B [Corynebacterium kutscheri]|uniref:Octanoyltransferase n=1 Tax=Corynebacterium kutscheri TaxID=35755 RepID=A0AB38VZ24_9CORY|nr:lipoyl(octanoyl) transferase LipB [Corynebacterium kutscheri]VEH08890.1 lipoate-protein ligase B [Corynebacterium kutscheri]VEH80019.1 lipoate-protein ligase B [Corynebacterium kutscheri]